VSGRGDALPALARQAIAERLGRPGPEPAIPSAPLDEPRGVFVTLRRRVDDDLRGCVGIVEPRYPLGEAVRRAAVSAALEDPRFAPVSIGELPSLIVHVSVMGPLAPCAPDAVEVGRHGVVIRHEGRSALFLPQVAAEQGWDREALLRQLCRKAGLPANAWRDPRSQLFVFETETYEE
jgi:AmmeMemoRadiSam system protein A